MRYAKILFLYFQEGIEQRARNFVYFLLSLFGPLVLILFWRGAHTSGNWNFSAITTYYLFFIIAGALLMAHIEDDVARIDIQEGSLVSYILKPFSYYWTKFFAELPWRVFQGFFGLITLFICIIFFKVHISIATSMFFIIATILSSFLAYILSFSFKMCLGLIALWTTDISGMYQFFDMLAFIFAGYIVPIYLFPHNLQVISYILPFAYMIYFPIAVLQGQLSTQQVLLFLGIQFGWVIIFYAIYTYLWKKGLHQFTGVGQ